LFASPFLVMFRLSRFVNLPGEILPMHFQIELEREDDGRWIAEVPDLPGVMVYGNTRAQALARAEALALRVSRERYETALAEAPDVEPDEYDRL
jgi:predicted RNase H-like HicB family nuclease